jgi:hypothetical protein
LTSVRKIEATPPSLRAAGFEDDDEDSLPEEACGSIITPAEKSASQARRAPKIGERSRENEAHHSIPTGQNI